MEILRVNSPSCIIPKETESAKDLSQMIFQFHRCLLVAFSFKPFCIPALNSSRFRKIQETFYFTGTRQNVSSLTLIFLLGFLI